MAERSLQCYSLGGYTRSLYQRQLAHEAVRGLDGIRAVIDGIDVDF